MLELKRKVLFTTTAYPPSIGGVQAQVEELREHLHNFDADVVTLWLRNRTDWLLGTTLKLAQSENASASAGVTMLAWSAATRARMAPLVSSYYLLPAVMARRIGDLMVPYLDQAVGKEHLLIHHHRIGREFLAHASIAVARRRGIPVVLTPYHHMRWRGYRYGGWIQIYRSADAVMTLTKAEGDELQRLGVDQDRIHVVGNAADPPLPGDPERFRTRVGVSTEPIVLFVGQQYDYKGVSQLFHAVEALRSREVRAQLVFLGPATPFSTRFFREHDTPWLHVMGKVDEQTKWDAIEASAVVCLPSAQESFGRVFLEAWSKGKPVIGGRIPSVSEVVREGETGLLVDPGSPEELTRALDRLINNPELAHRLGENGRSEINGRFSWDAVVGRIEGVYSNLLTRVAPS